MQENLPVMVTGGCIWEISAKTTTEELTALISSVILIQANSGSSRLGAALDGTGLLQFKTGGSGNPEVAQWTLNQDFLACVGA